MASSVDPFAWCVLTAVERANAEPVALCKRWTAQGVVAPPIPLTWEPQEHACRDLQSAHTLARLLEHARSSALIRGALRKNAERHASGGYRRDGATFGDTPRQWATLDFDRVEGVDPQWPHDPQRAIEGWISQLPEPFGGCSAVWSLSGSAGKPNAEGHPQLKLHLFLLLERPVAAAEWHAYARTVGLPAGCDVRPLCSPTQLLFTGAPLADPGVQLPAIAGPRSGIVEGLMGVYVVVPPVDAPEVRAQRAVATHEAIARTQAAMLLRSDPILDALRLRGALIGLRYADRPEGPWMIECLFGASHTPGVGDATSTLYYPPGCNGNEEGYFVCLHQSCARRPTAAFLAELGVAADSHVAGGVFAETRPATDASAPQDASVHAAPSGTSAEVLRAALVPVSAVTDVANAARLLKSFGGDVEINGGALAHWDGRRWVPLGQRRAWMLERAQCLPRMILDEAEKITASIAALQDEYERKAATDRAAELRKWAHSSGGTSRIKGAADMALARMSKAPQQIPETKWLLNLADGVLDLRSGTLTPHRRDLHLRILSDTRWNAVEGAALADAMAQWESFMERVQPDPTQRALLQRWIGYCATGDTREEIMMLHIGAGANGKSTFFDTLEAALGSGQYASHIDSALVLRTRIDHDINRNTALIGIRLAIAEELSQSSVLYDAAVKRMVGSGYMTARYMRENTITFTPEFKLNVLSNHFPKIVGTDDGMWRRITVIEWKAHFVGSDRDDRVKSRLRSSAVLCAVLHWVQAGAAMWIKEGLALPAPIKNGVERYRASQDMIAQFMNECLISRAAADGAAALPIAWAYRAYSRWCRDQGMMPLGRTQFARALGEHGIHDANEGVLGAWRLAEGA